ncbi:Neuronal acetylcholine receptor subunit alpha-6 [Fasciola hepatica]|uniref:Neuronal acetylcholine receptor subunit alpha-6 n=1 Tax=Fasciola hepatica TaxID=6192 RepID=A0A4E0RUV1_FASHE|nr:Neuronal acetylcholine receptor subunit alpha-6 [Fasciola hepatica]
MPVLHIQPSDMAKRKSLILFTFIIAQCSSQMLLTSQSRMRRGVAANVAASTSSKSPHRPFMQLSPGPTKSYADPFDEPQGGLEGCEQLPDTFMPEERLVAQLLHRRSLVVRPNGHNNQSSNPVHVNITYNVVQILAFSQAEETLSISGWFTIKWTDPRLSWDPHAFDNIREVNVPSSKLWIPDVGVMNGKSSTDFDFSAGVRGRLTVNWEGEVTWMHGAVLDTTCPLDVSFFPFDYQTCFLILTPWQSSEQQLLLRPFSHGSAVDNSYLPNSNVSEWEIQSVHFSSKKYRSDLNVTYQYVSIGIHLKRQPLYFVVLVLVPFSMLSALACLIFTLDDTGDRLSVALSLVLSMTMYVVIVSSNAPRSMRTLPVLGIFLLDQLGLLSVATVLAVINNKLFSSDELINWKDWVYVISGTGESKGSNGFTFARRYSARFHKLLKQDRRTHLEGQRTNPPKIRERATENYYPQWWVDGKDFKPDRLCTANRSSHPHITKHTWLNPHFHRQGSKESTNNSISNDDESLSIHPDSNFSCFMKSPTRMRSLQYGSIPDPAGIIRVTAFQYGHHPLCNNISGYDNAKKYPGALFSNPASGNNDSSMNNCSSCAKQFHESTSPRSPWVEPLRHERSVGGSPEQNSSQFSDSRSTCSSSSPTRFFRTTVTAHAAAAFAASKVLNDDQLLPNKVNKRGEVDQEDKAMNSRFTNEADPRTLHRSHSANQRDQDDETDKAKRLARAAASAAFRAAAIVNSGKPQKRSFYSTSHQNSHSTPKTDNSQSETLYPYRRLAARLDCIEMIAYLLMSTINAIVCLLIMPRFTQDPLPPKHWIT